MIEKNRLCFPVIVFFSDGDYHPYPRKKDLFVTDKYSIFDGLYLNIRIVDSLGNLYIVQNASIAKPYGFLRGFHPLYKNRLYWINLEGHLDGVLDLPTLKNMIISAIKKAKIPDTLLVDKKSEIEMVENQTRIDNLVKIMSS